MKLRWRLLLGVSIGGVSAILFLLVVASVATAELPPREFSKYPLAQREAVVDGWTQPAGYNVYYNEYAELQGKYSREVVSKLGEGVAEDWDLGREEMEIYETSGIIEDASLALLPATLDTATILLAGYAGYTALSELFFPSGIGGSSIEGGSEHGILTPEHTRFRSDIAHGDEGEALDYWSECANDSPLTWGYYEEVAGHLDSFPGVQCDEPETAEENLPGYWATETVNGTIESLTVDGPVEHHVERQAQTVMNPAVCNGTLALGWTSEVAVSTYGEPAHCKYVAKCEGSKAPYSCVEEEAVGDQAVFLEANEVKIGPAVDKLPEGITASGAGPTKHVLPATAMAAVETVYESSPELRKAMAEAFPPSSREFVPYCIDYTVEECEVLLDELGFVPKVDELVFPDFNIETEPGHVVETRQGGDELPLGETVEIEANPEFYPVPDPRVQPETAKEYAEELERAGVGGVEFVYSEKIGEIWRISRPSTDELAEAKEKSWVLLIPSGDSLGEGTSSEPGVEPAYSPQPMEDTKVELGVEPKAKTEGGGGTGGFGYEAPDPPGIHFPHFAFFCTKFPFGVPCWIYHEFQAWSATGSPPDIGLASFTVHGVTVPAATVNFGPLEPVMDKVRPFIVLFGTIGLVILFFRFATGSGAGNSSDSGGGDSDA